MAIGIYESSRIVDVDAHVVGVGTVDTTLDELLLHEQLKKLGDVVE